MRNYLYIYIQKFVSCENKERVFTSTNVGLQKKELKVCKTGNHPCWEDEAAAWTKATVCGGGVEQNTLTLLEDTTKLTKKPLNDE